MQIRNLNTYCIYATIAIAAILTGLMISLQNTYTLLVIISVFSGVAVIYFLKDWRWGLIAIFTWYAIVDFIRRFFEGTQLLLMVSDGLVALVLLIFFSQNILLKNKELLNNIPKSVKLYLAGFISFILIQSLNPGIPDPILRIAGMRTYLFYILAVIFGLALLKNKNDLKNIFIFLLILSVPLILLSFYQAISNPADLGIALSSMEHKIHSYGDLSVDLISSTFASSKRYGRFLFLVYPFLFGILRYYNKSKKIYLYIFILFGSANVISGSKEAVIMFILFHALYWLLNSNRGNRFVKTSIIILSSILIWITVLDFDYDNVTEENIRTKAILSNQDDWRYRLDSYLFHPFLNLYDNNIINIILGNGVGTYGQETMLSQHKEYQVYKNEYLHRGDSGLIKLISELGIFGLLYFFVMYISILFALWNKIKKLTDKNIYSFGISIFIIPLSWLILFIKSHSIISDGMVSFGLWLTIGLIFSLNDYPADNFILQKSNDSN